MFLSFLGLPGSPILAFGDSRLDIRCTGGGDDWSKLWGKWKEGILGVLQAPGQWTAAFRDGCVSEVNVKLSVQPGSDSMNEKCRCFVYVIWVMAQPRIRCVTWTRAQTVTKVRTLLWRQSGFRLGPGS